MKTLVIAEKPSVAGDIARALGGFKREKEYFESDQYVVSSAVGHLLEIVPPEGVEVKRGKWSLENLPVLPQHFDLVPIKASQDRLRALARLYKRDDIGALINACDAGREGELIFYNLYRYLSDLSGKKKSARAEMPVKRLWLSSMTAAAIRRGFDELRKGEDQENLRRAAVCRNEADWLVGINATRAMTALHSLGGFFLTTVGRVQTPTLAILVEREQGIKAFESRPYWEVRGEFTVAAGSYEGLWVHDKQTIAANKGDKTFRPERIFDEAKASAIVAACKGGGGQATETVKQTSEIAPMLLDLTSLQREANARFGMSARGALATAQSLYERHKLITYPRTDSRYLPQDYPAVVRKTLAAFGGGGNKSIGGASSLGALAQKALSNNWVVGANKRIFNDAKVSDHFAIIPVAENVHKPAKLQENERKIYDLICRRFIAVFYPAAKYLVTERITAIDEHRFLTKGKVLKEAGWREVMSQSAKDAPDLVAIAEGGEAATLSDINSEEKATQPPPRYTEATLLSAMEGAGKLVDDEELRDAMSERGLGTPATRAGIIEGLVRERYLVRDRRDLIPTAKAHSLIRLLSALKVDALTRPALTGDWEYQLRRIERAEENDTAFMEKIRKLTSDIVDSAKQHGNVENIASDDFVTLKAPCPQCGGKVEERHRRFRCAASDDSCGFFIWKAIGAREFSPEEMETLLTDGVTPELDGFRSKMGREFSARVKLDKKEDGKLAAMFDFDNTDADSMSADDLKDKETVGACPKCGAATRDSGGKYLCEKAVGENPACDFSFPRRVLQRDVPPDEMQKLLAAGKTSLLDKFVSRKTGRAFSAYLKIDLEKKDGKLLFEFEPRAAKKGARKFAAKKAAKKAS